MPTVLAKCPAAELKLLKHIGTQMKKNPNRVVATSSTAAPSSPGLGLTSYIISLLFSVFTVVTSLIMCAAGGGTSRKKSKKEKKN